MGCATATEAKQFFIDRITEQAGRDSILLSDAERHMLNWSESESEFTPDHGLVAAFEKQTTDLEFEAKIVRLITRAYGRDMSMRGEWREARSRLAEGDHYILVMIDRALGVRVRRWWPF